MKILHITDSHGTVKGPESRKDVYYITFLKKLYELGFVVKKLNIDMVIHTGDLFHTARVSDKFAGQVSEMIKAMGVPFYVVPGNHDIEGYTTDTIDQTKLGLLAKAGVVTILDRDNPIRITANQDGEEYTVAISGQEYYAHIDEGNAGDFEMQQDEADLNILAAHAYLTDTPQHPDIKCTMVNDVITDADIILTGHYHRSFEWDGPDVSIYNPGSMMRVEQTDYNKNHMPQYGILDITLNNNGGVVYDYVCYPFRIAQPSTVVFDYNAKYKAKTASITLDGFKNSISNTMVSIQPSMTIDKIINNICVGCNVDASVQNLALKVYHDTLQIIPDEFEVQQGYVEAQKSKKIVRVILDNFQSHEHTEINFDDGLNIIVGESNNGKTSILRAIMWVIDNQPLGTDFIMAGKDECKVSVCYDDGTSITRGRTRKDTGYYDVYYRDENGTLQRANYRGFTNAVPVEVTNVHQMPKVSITKDIETHLNVLSQLDGPFLLTESPLVKASAIGRITGTHVVDVAIKESNKNIQTYKKSVKTYESELKEKQDELQALPDIQMLSEYTSLYKAIVGKAKTLSSDIDEISERLTHIGNCDTSIAKQEKMYTECSVMISITSVIDAAIEKQKVINSLSTSFTSHEDIKLKILQQQAVLQDRKPFAIMKPVIDKAYSLSCFINELRAKIVRYNYLDENEHVMETQMALCNEYGAILSALVMRCQSLHDYSDSLAPKLLDIDNLCVKQECALQNHVILKRTAKRTEERIKEVHQQKNDFILSNGICPCCGQKVEESHVSSIITFMEEQ